jgi:hypothetical protein
LIEELEKQGSIDAIMSDQDDGIRRIRMPFEDESQCFGCPSYEILQRVAFRKTDEVRSRIPGITESRPSSADLFAGLPLPKTVVEIVQAIEDLATDVAGRSDMASSDDASVHGTRIDRDWLPGLGNPVGHCICLGIADLR